MKAISQRLSLLREAMQKNNISAVIISGTDPHASEYIPEYWKEREWISGFNGSAGTAVVALDHAGLWTDSRYFLQADEQLKDTGFSLMKQGLPDTPEITAWLSKELKAGEKVGINPQMVSVNMYAQIKNELSIYGIDLFPIDLLASVWTERPGLPDSPVFIHDVKYTGKTAQQKLSELRQRMKSLHSNVFILSALDDIAWLFNIRGNDVNYNPVTIAYAMVDEKQAILFIDAKKITPEVRSYLNTQNVTIAPYEEIYKAIEQISTPQNVLIDGAKLNQLLFEHIPAGCIIRKSMSPVFRLKSIKNETEIAGIRQAMIKDGIALVQFLKWLEEEVSVNKLTELSITEKLHEYRAGQPLFFGDSFNTIAGYAAHGAIVHYAATPESDLVLRQDNLLLLDSGGQYLDGTTDITRTIALGAPTPQQKKDYTLVLKGHINLATAVFPTGTRGSQLDILARKALWDNNINYGHGTGHGIGFFLNVHEGPQNIRMDENPIAFEPGMVTSNEPGLYRTNEYGIRIENLILTIPAQKTEFGEFLTFETLTLCPIDTTLIETELLSEWEVEWLNNYHKRVYDTLSVHLSSAEKKWLLEKCSPVKKQ